MPELPEVEFARTLCERVAAGRRVERVCCARDDIVYEGVTPGRFRRRLQGRRIETARRRGKYLWFDLDEGPHPLFHFGMTGAFRVHGDRPLELARGPRAEPGDGWPPRFTKLVLVLEGGDELAFTNVRRLGRIRLVADPRSAPPVSELGFDPLLEMPRSKAFAARLKGRRATLKGLLLDQSFSAGVGNWIADEVLYQARLDPRRRADELEGGEIERLRQALQRVVATAVRAGADKGRFPRGWLFHRRWGRDPRARTAGGERIEHIVLAGRTTAWVPSRQR